jgi:adenine deaminase
VVADGEPTVSPSTYNYPNWMTETISLSIDDDLFEVPDTVATNGRVNALEYTRELVTEKTEVKPPHEDGYLMASATDDLAKATIVDRHPNGEGEGFTGFVSGLGLNQGAIGTTLTVERTGVLVVGMDDASMRTAFEKLVAMDGGWVATEKEEVLTTLRTSIGASAADRELTKVADEYQTLEETYRTLGVDIDRPLFGLQTLCHPGVPSFRISFSGYANTLEQEIVGLNP